MARQVQGALPIVGLLSRIMTPTGGVGNDELVCMSCHTHACVFVFSAVGLSCINAHTVSAA